MKVKLTTSEKEDFVGYKNVHYEDLEMVYPNSCFELYCDSNVIKNIPNEYFNKFFDECCSKIRHGGIFIIHGADIHNISMFFNRRSIDEKELSKLIGSSYGFYNCRLISDAFKKRGFRIDHASINSYHYVVRGYRE